MRSTPTPAASRMPAARSAMGAVEPQATMVTSSPRLRIAAWPGTTGRADGPVRVARAGSFRQVFGYRMRVGRSPSSAACSAPAASSAVLGIATSSPGMCAKVASRVWAWNGPRPGRYAPHGARMTTGADHRPSVRQCMVASSEAIWLNARGRKSANCTIAMGRPPARARPIEVPTMVDSLSGALVTLPGNRVDSPRVMPNTSPLGSSMSCPSTDTRGSASSRSPSTSRMASSIVRGAPSSADSPGAAPARARTLSDTGAIAPWVATGSGASRARAAAARTCASTSRSSATKAAAATPSAIRCSRSAAMGSPSRAVARSRASRYTASSSALVWWVRRSTSITSTTGRRDSRTSCTARRDTASRVTGSRPSARTMGTPRNCVAGPWVVS